MDIDTRNRNAVVRLVFLAGIGIVAPNEPGSTPAASTPARSAFPFERKR